MKNQVEPSTNKTAPLGINVTDIKFEGVDGYKVNLSFEGMNLKDVENFGQIDPLLILYMKCAKDIEECEGDDPEFEWIEKGRTEMV